MQPNILIFDSGLGGLSVFKEIYQKYPQGHFIYVLDNEFFPYSEKSENEIISRAIKIVESVNQKFDLDLVVVACNTASTVVLPALREKFDCDIIGTVPAIKPAALISQTKHIALLATVGTVNRSYTLDLIDNYAKNCKVTKLGSTKLVELCEQKLKTNNVNNGDLLEVISSFVSLKDLDTIVLGCTHFPFVKEELQSLLPQVSNWVDSGEAIAKRAVSLLEQKFISNVIKVRDINIAFTTKKSDDFEQIKRVMRDFYFSQVEILN